MCDLTRYFIYFASMAMLELGISVEHAAEIGNTELARLVAAAAGKTSFLAAEATTVARCSSNVDVILQILSAIDRHFAPVASTTFLEWAAAAPASGETGEMYFQRLRRLASTHGRPTSELFERFKSGLAQPNNSHSMVVVASNFQSVVKRFEKPSAMADHMANDPMYQIPLLEVDGGDRIISDSMADGLPLKEIQSEALAYDLGLLYDGCRDLGLPLGPVPKCAVARTCAICEYLGVELLGPWAAYKPVPHEDEIYDHNPWRCPNVPRFVNELLLDYPGAVKDELLHPVDNPYVAGRAHALQCTCDEQNESCQNQF